MYITRLRPGESKYLMGKSKVRYIRIIGRSTKIYELERYSNIKEHLPLKFDFDHVCIIGSIHQYGSEIRKLKDRRL